MLISTGKKGDLCSRQGADKKRTPLPTAEATYRKANDSSNSQHPELICGNKKKEDRTTRERTFLDNN